MLRRTDIPLVGKRTSSATYVHYTGLNAIHYRFKAKAEIAIKIARYTPTINTIFKFSNKGGYVSIMEYDKFNEVGHPRLLKTTIVYDDRSIKGLDYTNHDNPPILHRKELFVHPDYEHYKKFKQLTKAEEDAGLYKDTKRIGYRKQWEELLESKRLMVVRHNLVHL